MKLYFMSHKIDYFYCCDSTNKLQFESTVVVLEKNKLWPYFSLLF